MKLIRLVFFIIVCSCSLGKLYAQSYLEFVENKGQWDSNISFKGQMANGSFLLKPDGGYRMILNNTDDLSAIGKYYHGESNGTNNNNVKAVTSASKNVHSSSSDNTNLILHSHAYEVKFLNANPAPVAIPDKALNTYNNYFIGDDKTKWASNCKIFQAVTYKNIYPNIDVRYYTNNGQLKYDIIVNPGGDANAVALYFDGVNSLKLKDGTLNVNTSVDQVKEIPPVTYLMEEVGRKEVACSYDVKGNIVRFKFDQPVSKTATLVIDPVLVFSTFTGSTADNWGYTATYDAVGNFYAGGIVFATGFPTLNGAFQSKFQGGSPYEGVGSGFDMGIIKFDAIGVNRIYATYIGGAKGNDQPHSLITDASGNLIIAGRTTSSDYPSTLSNPGTGGGWDIVITKLNATGTKLIGSIRIGGTGDDGVNIGDKYGTVLQAGATSINRNYGDDSRSEVILDNAGNIYVASCTQSKDFPTINALQTANNGGAYLQDAVVIKTNADISAVLFSTYLGGSGDDAAFVIDINPLTNSIFVAGGTASTDFPGDKANTIYSTNQGGISDGFVSIISNDGSQLIKTTYFGTSGTDIVYGINFDKFGFPYIMGTTTGSFPFINSPWNTTDPIGSNQKAGKQFITKLSQDLSSVIYSANFGTPNAPAPNISPTAFLVDRCENVYVSGWGGLGNSKDKYPSAGTTGLSITSNALQTTTDGSDFYFFVLERNAQSQLYGGFFGQKNGNYPDHVDGGTSRFDRNGIIYQAVCANCYGGTIFPTTPGVWAQNNGTTQSDGTVSGCNLAAIKIRFDLAGVAAGIQSAINGRLRDTSGCVPTTAFFKDTVGLAKQYIWDFNDGTARQSTISDTISHIFLNTGFYKVMMIGIDTTSCNQYDTSYVTMRIRNDEAALSLIGNKLLPCTSLAYQFTNTSVAPPGKAFGPNSFRIYFGDGTSKLMGSDTVTHTYAAIGTYNIGLVLLDTNYCNQADSAAITIRLAPNVKAQFTTPALGCVPYTAVINNTSVGGTGFVWDFGDGTTTTSTQVNPNPPPHLYTNTGNYIIKLVATDTATCNKIDSASFTISVNAKPVAGFTAAPQPPKTNTAIIFTNTSSGAVSYKWFFGDGDSLLTNSTAAVSHLYNASGTFNACVIAFNAAGCTDTLCRNVTAIIIPVFDVPNAFSPNGDGVNDKVFVKGFGISKMKWDIYNRWGTLVFESADKNIGWDGTYKGVLQPQEVYFYVVQVEMSDGTKYLKKGDITLLR